MKNLILTASVALIFSSCNNNELTDNRKQNDSLLFILNERDASITEFITSFNDIQQNLDSVAIGQQIITLNANQIGELKQDQKTRINNEILAINNLMNQNRAKLLELTLKVEKLAYKNKALDNTIRIITHRLTLKDNELCTLNEKLESLKAEIALLQTSVNILTAENEDKASTIAANIVELHTAYYVIGKSKDLQDAKIIDRMGGLLGIGKTTKLRSDIDNTKFIRIDLTETTSIPINSKNVKIVTSHPDKSYILETDVNDDKMVTNLVIKNFEYFWSTSKYLVIVKK